MTGGWMRGSAAAVVLSVVCAAPAAAQHEGHQQASRPPAKAAPAPEPKAPDRVAGYEPIRCWRQSTAGAVAIGEPFTVVLTCAVYDAENAQVVPDESRLNVASIQMQPFEILGGTHPRDVRRGPRRFIQYDYQLRIINPDAIGHDVNIPPLTISYRIHSRVGAAGSVEGRDLSYLLPMMPIKVLSLVPLDASDIRDASEASLGAIEALRFRSSAYRVLAMVLGGLAAVMAALAIVPLTRRRVTVAAVNRHAVSEGAVLRRAAAELSEVQARTAATGWDDDALSRALSASRLIAAAAIGRGLSQKPVNGAVPGGRLLVSHGLLRRVTATVASAVTADDVARYRKADESLSTTRRQQLEAIERTLATLTAAAYAPNGSRHTASLDEDVRQTIGAAAAVAADRAWWKTWRR